jgi:hypothetical protein
MVELLVAFRRTVRASGKIWSLPRFAAHVLAYRRMRRVVLSFTQIPLWRAIPSRSETKLNQTGTDPSGSGFTPSPPDRDRGESLDSSPPTPPDKRVRIRRFEKLRLPLCPPLKDAGGSLHHCPDDRTTASPCPLRTAPRMRTSDAISNPSSLRIPLLPVRPFARLKTNYYGLG